MNAFPKVHSLGTKYVKDIFMEPVEITEKLDGSQIGWGKVGGEFIIRSKGTIINKESPNNLFQEGVAYLKSIEKRIPDNMFFMMSISSVQNTTLFVMTEYLRITLHFLVCFLFLIVFQMTINCLKNELRYLI